MAVLILSRSENIHANKVEEYVLKLGAIVYRINSDLFFVKKKYSITLGFLQIEDILLNKNDITGIFIHHPRVDNPEGDFEELDINLWKASWRNFLLWVYDFYKDVLFINNPNAIRKNATLFHQLDIAKNIGFSIPKTLVTNSLDQLNSFFLDKKQILIKAPPLTGSYQSGKRILSNLVDFNDLDKETLLNSPCYFQEYIEKAFELRVNVVGTKVFACKIDSQKSKKSKIDWRNYDIANVPHKKYNLDNVISEKCISIVSKLGLSYGAIDLIVTKESQYFFLECNSQGNWMWIEQLTGAPITEEIAKLLVDN